MHGQVGKHRALNVNDLLFPAVVRRGAVVADEAVVPLFKLVVVVGVVGLTLDADGNARAVGHGIALDPNAEAVVFEALDSHVGRGYAARALIERLGAVVIRAD